MCFHVPTSATQYGKEFATQKTNALEIGVVDNNRASLGFHDGLEAGDLLTPARNRRRDLVSDIG
jgi:hypothetical protein